jgi:putative serine protease PepD
VSDTTQPPAPAPDEPGSNLPAEPWEISVESADPGPSGPEPEPRYVVTRTWADGRGPYASASEPSTTSRSETQGTTEPPRRSGFWRMVWVALLAALVGAATATAAIVLFGDNSAGETPVTVVERVATEILSPEDSGSPAAAVARRVLPSIVTVQVRAGDVGAFVPDGSGSGVVLSSDGLLVTNNHVVEGAEQERVIFADGRTYPAEIVGVDALTDLAVLRIDATGLTPIELGSTEEMAIGDTAIAVGSPLGLEGGPSVTVGVVSAFERRLRTSVDEELFGLLQTDAPITRGSSGGALVDNQGRLIGITTAIGVSDVGAEGLGFAIPIELVSRITDDLIDFGEARHAFLGVTGTTFYTEADDGATIPAGVSVASVFEDTAAQAAGIQPGDVVLSVGGKPVTTMEQLVTVVRLFGVDESVNVIVTRDGDELTIPVTLLERPEGV